MRFEVGQLRYGDALKFALLSQDIQHDGWRRPRVRIAEKIDDIVKISWPCSFGQRPNLFAKYLFIGVGKRLNPNLRRIAIGMKNWHTHGRKHQPLISSQIQFDAR